MMALTSQAELEALGDGAPDDATYTCEPTLSRRHLVSDLKPDGPGDESWIHEREMLTPRPEGRVLNTEDDDNE